MANKESAGISYDILENIAVLSTTNTGWKKELNIVSWNNTNGKYDIREWDSNYERMSRGITLTEDEAKLLMKALRERFE